MTEPEKARRNQDGTFAPGVSGNPAGKPVGARHFETLFREAVKRIAEGEEESDDILIVKKVIAKAKGGDLKAADMIFDRHDGKVIQSIAGVEGQPIVIQVTKYGDPQSPLPPA